MREFCQSLQRDARLWFKNLEVDSIGSWMDFHDVFLRYWGENKSYEPYLSKFYVMKKREDESLIIFNRRFHSFYYSIPKDIKPPKVMTMLAYANAFDYKFYLWLRATKEPTLAAMQEATFEIEYNIMAVQRLKSEEQDEIMQGKNTQRPFK